MRSAATLRSLETRTLRQRYEELKGRVFLKANTTFGPARRRRWKRDVLLPVRNRLLGHKSISLKVDGTSLRLAPVGRLGEYLWTKPRSEIQQLKLLLRFLEPGQTFFDVGADAGAFAMAVAKRIGQSGVYAFEPCDERFQLLRRNLELNGLTRLRAVQTALGDHGNETAPNDLRGVDGPWSATVPSSPTEAPGRPATVPTTTVDALVESNAIPKVDAMRVGVGGAELLVFQGSKKLLDRGNAPIVIYETSGRKTRRFGYHPVETLWFLADCGFSLFAVDPRNGRVGPRQPNGQYDALIVAAKVGHIERLRMLGFAL